MHDSKWDFGDQSYSIVLMIKTGHDVSIDTLPLVAAVAVVAELETTTLS